MICPHIVDWSMLLGAVLAYGVMWPAIAREAGVWYPAGLKERDFSGLYGYKVGMELLCCLCAPVYRLYQ